MYYVAIKMVMTDGEYTQSQEVVREHETLDDAVNSIKWGLKMAGRIDGEQMTTSYTIWEEKDGN